MVDFLVAVPFGIGLGLAIIAFAYMIGSLLHLDGMKSWSRLELGELAFSAILVLIIAEVLSPAGQLAFTKAVTGVQMDTDTVQVYMYTYMEKPLEKVTEAIAISSMHLSKIVSYNYNYQLPVPYLSPTGSSSPGAGAGSLQMAVMMGMDSTALNLLLAHAMQLIYVFLVFALSTFFMPLGIILRCIPPLRKIGSLLLGISLAVYLVFPAAVYWSTALLGSAVCTTSAGGTPPSVGPSGMPNTCNSDYVYNKLIPDVGRPPSASFVCSPVVAGLYNAGEQVPSWVIAAVACIPTIPFGVYPGCVGKPGLSSPPVDGFGVAGIVSYLMWLAQYGFPVVASSALKSAGDNLDPAFMSTVYHSMVNYLLPLAVLRNLAVLFMALIQLAVTIIMARELSQALGAEGQFYGLTKLV